MSSHYSPHFPRIGCQSLVLHLLSTSRNGSTIPYAAFLGSPRSFSSLPTNIVESKNRHDVKLYPVYPFHTVLFECLASLLIRCHHKGLLCKWSECREEVFFLIETLLVCPFSLISHSFSLCLCAAAYHQQDVSRRCGEASGAGDERSIA